MNAKDGLQQNSKTTDFYIVSMVFVILLASAERIYGIDRQSLWSDELFAVIASYKSSFNEVWPLLIGDSHPPGYVAFMYWLLPWAGYSDFAIRSHALLFGILWMPLVFWLGRRWFSSSTGLIAASLIASSYVAIYYSQEARAYSMLGFFNLLGLICFLEMLFGQNCSRRYLIGFIVSTVLSLYFHYSGFVFLCSELLLYAMLLIFGGTRLSLRKAAILFAVPLVLYAPWLGIMYGHLVGTANDWSVSAAPTMQEVYFVFQRLLGPDSEHLVFYLIVLPAAVFLALYQAFRRRFTEQVIVVGSLVFLMMVPVMAFYIKSQISAPIFEKRYFLSAIPIAAILAGYCLDWLIVKLVSPAWKKISVSLLVVVISGWTITANVRAGLYSEIAKDPVREAVDVVASDIKKNSMHDNYTVVMSHNWFEHYLRQRRINFDDKWEFRSYYIAHQVEEVAKYLEKKPQLEYFYYLALREQNSQGAAEELKGKYRLISMASVAVPTGSIDVYKFSVKEKSLHEIIGVVPVDSSSSAVKALALDVVDKSPAVYAVVMTHDWMERDLRQNGVRYDENWEGRKYIVDAQSDAVFSYLKLHPDISTVYYLAMQEQNSESAALMLQLRFKLVSEQPFQTPVGKLILFKFDVGAAPVLSETVQLRLKASPSNRAAEWVAKDARQLKQDSYSVVISHAWFQQYLRAQGVHVDEQWDGRFFYSASQIAELSRYQDNHLGIKYFYYMALDASGLQSAVDALGGRMDMRCEASIDTPVGRIRVMRFEDKDLPAEDRISCAKS